MNALNIFGLHARADNSATQDTSEETDNDLSAAVLQKTNDTNSVESK
jgi:hypothetical protein